MQSLYKDRDKLDFNLFYMQHIGIFFIFFLLNKERNPQ